MPIPDASSIDITKSYVVQGQTYKDMIVVLKALWTMTNNNPNVLSLRTVNICIGNVVQKMDVIGTLPRAGL